MAESQADHRRAIRQLDEQFHQMNALQLAYMTKAQKYLTLEKRPKDFPPKRIDILELMLMEARMSDIPEVYNLDDIEELLPQHQAYYEFVRKINNYET